MIKFKKIVFASILAFCVEPVFAFDFLGEVDINIFGSEKESDVVLWQEGPNQYFKYANQDTSSFGENDHPVQLSQASVSTALKLLKTTIA